MNPKKTMQKFGIEQAMKYVRKDPDKNLVTLMNWADRFAGDDFIRQRKDIRDCIENPDNPYYSFIRETLKKKNSEVVDTLVVNFFVNAVLNGWKTQEKLRKEYNCNIPWAILMDPTSACNLHCTGCWAAEYGNKLNLSYDELDSIINQANELGVYVFLYTGGEPLVRKDDIIKLCEVHDDCVFISFTNATLIDEAFADEMLRVKNFIPAISLEGFEEATDGRRGHGTFQKTQDAIKILNEKDLIFGISTCYTSANFDSISSEEFYDALVEMGAYFIWFFHYMPIGNDAVPELLPTPAQRQEVYKRIRKFRMEKPLFAIDFQNDGEYVNGCIAGGKRYLHINANGDIDPCAFIHYSDSNIREKTLLEALQSPLFMAYHDNMPFNDNLLKPCPMLENPGQLKMMVDKTGAKSTDLQSPEDIDDLVAKTVPYAKEWTPVANQIWNETEDVRAARAERAARN